MKLVAVTSVVFAVNVMVKAFYQSEYVHIHEINICINQMYATITICFVENVNSKA